MDAVKTSAIVQADSLRNFRGLVSSAKAVEIFKASPPHSFARELLAHLLRLLPLAAASLDGAATFIECLEPFEYLEDFVLPAYFYRAISLAKEPTPSRGHDSKRQNTGAVAGAVASMANSASFRVQVSEVTGLDTLREYLCMNGRDTVECGRRTLASTLTRALLGSWEGSAIMGRELFDQSVLKNPDRSGPVGLGLEVLLQSLVQDDGLYEHDQEEKEGDVNGQQTSSSEDERGMNLDVGNGDSGTASSRTFRRPTSPAPARTSPAALSFSDETRACTTIVGNYVRACGDTSASFFRDIIPTVLLMGMGRVRRGQGNLKRISRRLAMLFRNLVESTRFRRSFNVERMVVHTVKEMKGWGDPATALHPKDKVAGLDDDDNEGFGGDAEAETTHGNTMKAKTRCTTGNDKLRRRGLVLACLDVLGPTASCASLIRREMVEGESKANLRSAVADGLLEYRRTCENVDADAVQAMLLEVLKPLAEDSVLGVRLSAVAAIAEGCSSDSVPATSLLLKRCLDTAPKVRALTLRLLVDEIKLGVGVAGASLARSVLAPASITGRGGRVSYANCGVHLEGENSWGGRLSSEDGEDGLLLGELIRHHQTLEETDRERFPILLKNLVGAVLQGPPVSSTADSTIDLPGSEDIDKTPCASGIDAPGAAVAAAVTKTVGSGYPWHNSERLVAWEDFRVAAARLWGACRPVDREQVDVLDKVLSDVFMSICMGDSEA